ncbi:hypothetical protein ACSLOD_28400, partial [Escherichia coli]
MYVPLKTPSVAFWRKKRKKTRKHQAKRGRKGGIAKGEAYDDKRFMALCMLENGYSQKAIAAMLEV